jgi:hypothetical protein
MRNILIDLGALLDADGSRRRDALGALEAIRQLRDPSGRATRLAVVADIDGSMNASDLVALEGAFRQRLQALAVDGFFVPFEERVTISAGAGERLPALRLLFDALRRMDEGPQLEEAIYITANPQHANEARYAGMQALCIEDSGPDSLTALIPFVRALVEVRRLRRPVPPVPTSTLEVASPDRRKDPAIVRLIDDVNATNLIGDITRLSAFPSRHAASSFSKAVREHIYSRFRAVGYSDTQLSYQAFPHPGTATQYNVLCGPKQFSKPLILVCAHYDSTADGPDKLTNAPGADDNASGVAALFELARLLRGRPLTHDVLFAAFGGEEEGLHGSRQCAQEAIARRWPIRLVINMDMIGVRPGTGDFVDVDRDLGNVMSKNDAKSKAFARVMTDVVSTYSTLGPQPHNLRFSDYRPFEAEGLVCIGACEGDISKTMHTKHDTVATIEADYARAVTQIVLATILTIGK